MIFTYVRVQVRKERKKPTLKPLKSSEEIELKRYFVSEQKQHILSMMKWIESIEYTKLNKREKQIFANFARALSTSEGMYCISITNRYP